MRGRRVAEICCGGLEHICEHAADLSFTQLTIATQSYEERNRISCFLSSSECLEMYHQLALPLVRKFLQQYMIVTSNDLPM